MDKNLQKLQNAHLHPSSPLRVLVWYIRRILRDGLGRDILDVTDSKKPARAKLRKAYLHADSILVKHLPRLEKHTPRTVAMTRIREILERELGYEFHEVDVKRPWGGYFRIVSGQTDKFINDFFPNLRSPEARAQLNGAELSPKIMIVIPGRKLSWQYHYRRGEHWHFLTPGVYYESADDKLPRPSHAKAGQILHFRQGTRHRGGAFKQNYAIIAEIWEHTEPDHPSDESDIVRLQDDFGRPKRPRQS